MNLATFTHYAADAVRRGASDLHFKADAPFSARIGGQILPLSAEPLGPDEVDELIRVLLTPEQLERLVETRELDLSIALEGLPRFRANLHFERGGPAGSLRLIRTRVPAFEDLGLPLILKETALRPRGLILVTGPTGSGKTTTMAAMVDHINRSRRRTIVTIEDPIEYLHTDQFAYIRQREVGLDTRNFPEALRRVLRQDPDVIVIGEMRDLETITTALTAAETGHLVIATLHTNSAEETVNRIIDVYPPVQQHQVRIQLASSLAAVLSQHLLARADGGGLALAYELMLGVHAVRRLIRDEKTYSIRTYIQSGKAHGMVALDASLAHLYKTGVVAYEEAESHAQEPEEFKKLVG